MPQPKLTISEVADLLGIAPKMIRYYHETGALPEPERGENGYRLYSAADLGRIQRIRELQSYGLSLKQVSYVLEADEPDVQLRAFLVQRDRELADQLLCMQQQQARIRAFLATGEPGDAPLNPAPLTSSYEILHRMIKTVSHNLADVLMEVEKRTLSEIDRLPHNADYARFWEEASTVLVRSVQPHEHFFILWMERYLALANMTHDDLQAQAWLQELRASSSAPMLIKVLDLPETDALPMHEQMQIRRLIPVLLYEQASPLQRAFLAAVKQGSMR